MRVVKASFSDGTVIERKEGARTYTHAWLAKGTQTESTEPPRCPLTWRLQGFASSEELAGTNMAKEIGSARKATLTFCEIVAVEEIAAIKAA